MNVARLTSLIMIAASVIVIGVCAWDWLQQHKEYNLLRQTEARTLTNIATQRHVLREKQIELERLRNDPAFVEMMIRRRLGYAKPGEIIYRFERPEDILRQSTLQFETPAAPPAR